MTWNMSTTGDLEVPMQQPTPPHRACSQLMVEGLTGDVFHRFVLHADDRPVALSVSEARGEFQDPFAGAVLAGTGFPRTAGEVSTTGEN